MALGRLRNQARKARKRLEVWCLQILRNLDAVFRTADLYPCWELEEGITGFGRSNSKCFDHVWNGCEGRRIDIALMCQGAPEREPRLGSRLGLRKPAKACKQLGDISRTAIRMPKLRPMIALQTQHMHPLWCPKFDSKPQGQVNFLSEPDPTIDFLSEPDPDISIFRPGTCLSYQASPCTSSLPAAIACSISYRGRRTGPSGVKNSNQLTSLSSARILATASGRLGMNSPFGPPARISI